VAGTTWEGELAGCPCSISSAGAEWTVIFASSLARSTDLVAALQTASGGLVDERRARWLAAKVSPRRKETRARPRRP